MDVGIGLQLTHALLLRENTTVVATKRGLSTSSVDLEGLSRAENSKLVVVPLAVEGREARRNRGKVEGSVGDLVERLRDLGVDRIDVLILNAGAAMSFESVRETRMEELWAHFEVNTVWQVQIYQVLRPLLLNRLGSANRGIEWKEGGLNDSRLVDDRDGDGERRKQKKIVYISSFLGSIEGIDDAAPSLAYGISKAGANYFVRKVHFEEGGEGSGTVSLAVHPGWVKTQNGQAFADSVGVEEPPLSLEESVEGVLGQIDIATRETTSGKFVSYNGAIIPW
ncbi:hypothetical protein DID88_010397 [Monilinia fructigena]|uniref:Uncharacterized protein n=1 Tax=Monilinia fructigena TaxID=38457 RepID=A0A395ILN2_9HELO|nr:hypothetical protein DID88_010397 [Monilinia fructigena]